MPSGVRCTRIKAIVGGLAFSAETQHPREWATLDPKWVEKFSEAQTWAALVKKIEHHIKGQHE